MKRDPYVDMLNCAMNCYHEIMTELDPHKDDPRVWTKVIKKISEDIDKLAESWGTKKI